MVKVGALRFHWYLFPEILFQNRHRNKAEKKPLNLALPGLWPWKWRCL